ncbi:hypothetical protein BLNAU_9335 [Blattamonas nauphoetae]|uniref:Uncharacterized protein n=1 Tax=Blattamonas nauphoetae TaxID=2049346 RepID=A0ABQ9XVZ2_9EUKA|nr:hypothetical protein BLNAU_9335 [Blattamonas nauphoetae]
MWIVVLTYGFVKFLESNQLVDTTVRLTDDDGAVPSPRFQNFAKLLEPEIDKLRKHFDPDLFEEARRITLWKELLQKVADRKEVLNDKSFLKATFFKPSLLSLQTKFQQLVSSLDESPGSSSSSLLLSLSAPNSSLRAHLNTSLQSLNSSFQNKQEYLQLLTIIHSLLSSPLSSISTSRTVHPEPIAVEALLFNHSENIDPTETFHSSLFDEADHEILTRSLTRCSSVCDLVGADQCILDIPKFFDRLVSVLGSSNSHVRAAALKIFDRLEEKPCVVTLLPRLWNRLHSSFRDGRPEEQYALLRISMTWIYKVIFGASLPPFAWALRHSITKHEQAKVTDLILSFEQRQHTLTRISSELEHLFNHNRCDDSVPLLIAFSLLLSFLTKCDFPPIGTSFLTAHPDELEFKFPHSLHNTSLCGFHALCRRGVHIDLFESEFTPSISFSITLHHSSSASSFPFCGWSQNTTTWSNLCHLPSLAGAQRGVLQTLSSHSGIPSLVAPLTSESFQKRLTSILSKVRFVNDRIRLLSLFVRYVASDHSSNTIERISVKSLTKPFLCPYPAIVSTVLEFFRRFVSVSSDAVRIKLVKLKEYTSNATGTVAL